MHQLPQVLQQKWRLEFWCHHVGSLFLRRETVQGMENIQQNLLPFCRTTNTNNICCSPCWAEDERYSGGGIYQGGEPHGTSFTMPRAHVPAHDGLLDLQVSLSTNTYTLVLSEPRHGPTSHDIFSLSLSLSLSLDMRTGQTSSRRRGPWGLTTTPYVTSPSLGTRLVLSVLPSLSSRPEQGLPVQLCTMQPFNPLQKASNKLSSVTSFSYSTALQDLFTLGSIIFIFLI